MGQLTGAGAAFMTRVVSKEFLVADMNVRGEITARQMYRYNQLEQVPGAVDLIATFSARIWRTPAGFEGPVRTEDPELTIRWLATARAAGIATLRHEGRLVSLSLLASGIEPDADQITLTAFQHRLLGELHDSGYEPAFDLLSQSERPLVATVNFSGPSVDPHRMVAALTDRCFAAAFFRYLGIA